MLNPQIYWSKKGLTVEDALQTEAIVSMFPSDTGEGLGSYSLSLQGTTDFLARDFDLFTLDEGTKLEAVMGAELGFCCN